VRVCWPSADEFDDVIRLNNSPQMLRWSFEGTAVDPGWIWIQLRFRLGTPQSAQLVIRSIHSNRFLGTIGWSDWDRVNGAAWLGQLVLDVTSLRQFALHRADRPGTGLALDAGMAFRDYLFERLGLSVLHTYYLPGNVLSERITTSAGLRVYDSTNWTRADGSTVTMMLTRLSREDWLNLPRHARWIGAGPGEMAAG